MPIKISIVLPIFNEQKIIKNSLKKIHNWVKIKKYYYEIVVVNDGSTDQSLNVLKNLKKIINIKILNNKHKGQFSSIIDGIKSSKYSNVLVLEADLSVKLFEVEKIIDQYFKNDYKVVSASRNLKKSKNFNKPFLRKFLTKANLLLFKLLFKTNINDPQISVKMYDKSLFLKYSKNLKSPSDGMKSTELLLNFAGNNKKIKELPIRYYYRDSNRNVEFSKFIYISYISALSLLYIWINCKKKFENNIFTKKIVRF